jgi:exopolysaccharide biosynthesis polyprenyl glycosylphosphotransferase
MSDTALSSDLSADRAPELKAPGVGREFVGRRRRERRAWNGSRARLRRQFDELLRASERPTAAVPHQAVRDATLSDDLRAALTVVWDFASTMAYFAALMASGLLPSLVGHAQGVSILRHPLPWLFALLSLAVIAVMGGYADSGPIRTPLNRWARLYVAAAMATWITCIASTILGRHVALGDLAIASLFLPFWWLLGRHVVDRTVSRPQRIVVLGSGVVAQRVIGLAQRAGKRLDVVGCIDDAPARSERDGHPRLLGSVSDLAEILREHRVDRIVVAFSPHRDRELIRVLRDCDASGVDVDIVPRLFEFVGMESKVSVLGDLPVLQVRGQRTGRWGRLGKRATDIVLSALMLVATLPLLAAVSGAVLLDSGGPVIYRQRRIGRLGKPFDILKFRTMLRDAETRDEKLIRSLQSDDVSLEQVVRQLKPNSDPRVTRVGRLLRSTSLDELPQLWNVLRGDMSLVGPRPLRPFEVEKLSAWQLVRQDVRPGITGLWQILGRSHVLWDDRMQLDYTYVRHWSPASDFKILGETIPAVLRRDGAR